VHKDIEQKRAYDKARYAVNKEQRKAHQKAYREAHPEKIALRKKAYYEANKDKVQAYQKANRERIAAQKKAYDLANPHIVIAKTARRRAAKLLRTPKWLTLIDFERIETQYKLASILTKLHGEPWHVDHIIPLQGDNVSGFHVPTNLRVIRGVENLSKHNKYEVA
jgi:hypothetical protein